MQSAVSLNSQELRAVSVLASIFSLRMLGLCMLLPVFALEAWKYPGANAQLIGLAVGAYGLGQALLQIPFGMLSDRFGRKPIIILGLAFITLGSFVAAFAANIYWLVLGRILQGCGAIGGVVVATLADYTRVQVRTSSMAILGVSIGLSFAVALVLGPWLNQLVGMTGVFLLIGMLALFGGGLLQMLPREVAWRRRVIEQVRDTNWLRDLMSIVGNKVLLQINYGVFVLHASLSAFFLILPGYVQQNVGISEQSVWKLYLIVLLLAMGIAWGLIGGLQRRRLVDGWQWIAILGLLFAEGLLYIFKTPVGVGVILIVFFTAFCVLEANLPMLVSKYAPNELRGAALGMYSSLQFLGVFVGGLLGGYLHSHYGFWGVVGLCLSMGFIWLVLGLAFKSKEKVG